VETEDIIKSKDFINLLKGYGNIYLNYNNHIEKINHGASKKNIIKIITYKELLMELSTFENKSINYFVEHGLDKNINKNANITLIITNNRNKTKLESYDFSYKDENKNIGIDIPYYHKDVPDGFSVFCTDEEFQLVINHVNRRESRTKNKRKEKKKEEKMISEPEPSKKNFICQLCRSRFDNYIEHIISEAHIRNIKKHKNSFNKLSLTFKRIVNNNLNIISNSSSNLSSGIKTTFSKSISNEIGSIFEFSPEDIKRINNKQSYNLRAKKSPSFDKNNYNCFNYFLSTSKNNNIKIIKNENDASSPQQQVSSTTSSNFRNILTIFDDISEINMKKSNKRKRNDDDEYIYNELNLKNKKIKI